MSATPEPPAPTERRFRCTACGGEFDEMEVTCPAGQYHCGPCVPVIEPPAPTPSATTDTTPRAGCAATFVSKEQCELPAGHAGPHRSHSLFPPTMGAPFEWGHDRVPPASAPAATAEVWTCRDCGKRFTDVSDAFRHEEAQRHHVGPAAPSGETPEPRPAKPHVSWTPDARFDGNPPRPYHRCDLCGATDTSLMLTPDGKKTCFLRCGRGAPTGEEAETADLLAKLRNRMSPISHAECRRVADLLTAQATALAALRARETELTAALVRVMAWNDVGFHDNGLPPLIVQDIRAALAPRQPEERQT